MNIFLLLAILVFFEVDGTLGRSLNTKNYLSTTSAPTCVQELAITLKEGTKIKFYGLKILGEASRRLYDVEIVIRNDGTILMHNDFILQREPKIDGSINVQGTIDLNRSKFIQMNGILSIDDSQSALYGNVQFTGFLTPTGTLRLRGQASLESAIEKVDIGLEMTGTIDIMPVHDMEKCNSNHIEHDHSEHHEH